MDSAQQPKIETKPRRPRYRKPKAPTEGGQEQVPSEAPASSERGSGGGRGRGRGRGPRRNDSASEQANTQTAQPENSVPVADAPNPNPSAAGSRGRGQGRGRGRGRSQQTDSSTSLDSSGSLSQSGEGQTQVEGGQSDAPAKRNRRPRVRRPRKETEGGEQQQQQSQAEQGQAPQQQQEPASEGVPERQAGKQFERGQDRQRGRRGGRGGRQQQQGQSQAQEAHGQSQSEVRSQSNNEEKNNTSSNEHIRRPQEPRRQSGGGRGGETRRQSDGTPGHHDRRQSGNQQDSRRQSGGGNQQDSRRQSGGTPRKPRKSRFPAYLAEQVVKQGIANGTLLVGNMRVNQKKRSEAYVTVEGFTTDFFLEGLAAQNRAFDGDLVVIEVNPIAKWRTRKEEEPAVEPEADPNISINNVSIQEVSDDEADEVETKLALLSLVETEKLSPAQLVEKARHAESDQQPSARVVAIYEPKHGILHSGFLRPCHEDGKVQAADRYASFYPNNRKFPPFFVPLQEIPDFKTHAELYENVIVLVELQSWDEFSGFPSGKFISRLGQAGDIIAETEALLQQNSVDSSAFNDAILDSLPTSLEITPDILKGRKDLRTTRIFTIDPASAKDLDDALHCTPLPNGNFEVGVHIADVTHFLQPGTDLDKLAESRATTVYLVQKAIPMLPSILCEELCSLHPGVDRLAFSTIWELTPTGEIVSEWIGKTVIRSCSKMSYDVAQKAIVGDMPTGWWDELRKDPMLKALGPYDGVKVEDCVESILDMWKIAKCLKQKRYEQGSLALNNSKLAFKLDAAGNPIQTWNYVTKEANNLVEEFMLLSNERVAICIAKKFPECALLRNHIAPQSRGLAKLSAFLEEHKLGTVDLNNSKTFNDSLIAMKTTQPPHIFQTIQFVATKAMQLATYISAGETPAWRHYALALPCYTHFTSPIRRYADVMVHRQLAAAIGWENYVFEPQRVTGIAAHCNDRKLAARKAQDQSSIVYLCVFLKTRRMVTEAVVLSLGEKFIHCFLPSFGLDTRVYFEDVDTIVVEYQKQPELVTIKWPHPGGPAPTTPEERKIRDIAAVQTLKPLQLFTVVLTSKIKKPPIDFKAVFVNPVVEDPELTKHTGIPESFGDFDVNKFDNS